MTISGIDCLIAIANLCFHSADSVVFGDGLTSWATVHSHGYEVEILLRSDYIVTPDWSKMAEACADGVCIAYFKHCAESNTNAVTCDYYFSQPGEAQNTKVTITADSTSDLMQAEKRRGRAR